MAESSHLLTIKLLNIKDYSHITLKCDGQEFKLHRAIVCAQSPVMAAALKGDFMAKTGVLNVSFDIESVRRLIEFMCTGDYQVSSNPALDILSSDEPDRSCTIKNQPGDTEIGVDTAPSDLSVGIIEPLESISDRLICHGRMNSIADYYDMPTLAATSTSKAQAILVNEWSVESFHDLLQQSLDSTGDRNFIRMLGAEAVRHIYEFSESHIFDEGGVAERLAPYILPECILRMKAAKDRERELVSSLSFQEEAHERESRESARLSQNVDECIQLLNRHESCRNPRCDAEFNCYIDHKGPSHEQTYILRCARCRCRHE
ncbi:hypothetical protein F4801DRAFT_42108 [Xylaria longipes]|nr:hypothetical protein F4801DRAFT_42108 [Xylaria longipes]